MKKLSESRKLKMQNFAYKLWQSVLILLEELSPLLRLVLVCAIVVLVMMQCSCCAKQPPILEFQKPQIPPALLIPRTQIEQFAGSTCDDLTGYTFYAITKFNDCAADMNALQNMVK